MASLFSYPPLPTISVGPVTLHTWGLFVALGILIAALLAVLRARRFEIRASHVWNIAFQVTVAGLIGARLLYVLEYWRDFWADPWRVLAIWEGGMSVWGGILLGVYSGWRYARHHDLGVRQLAAAVAPSLLLGDAIGRLGGAISHMYPGRPTAFVLSTVIAGVRRHEVGLELAVASFLGFLVALLLERWWRRAGRGAGRVIATVVLWYAGERLVLDFFRAADLPGSDLRYAGFTLAQYFALAAVVAGVWLWFRWKKVFPPKRPHL